MMMMMMMMMIAYLYTAHSGPITSTLSTERIKHREMEVLGYFHVIFNIPLLLLA